VLLDERVEQVIQEELVGLVLLEILEELEGPVLLGQLV
jgi:hypothetical protein